MKRDNGPHLKADEFSAYLTQQSIEYHKVATSWLQEMAM